MKKVKQVSFLDMNKPYVSATIVNEVSVKDNYGTSGYYEVIVRCEGQWRRLFFAKERNGKRK